MIILDAYKRLEKVDKEFGLELRRIRKLSKHHKKKETLINAAINAQSSGDTDLAFKKLKEFKRISNLDRWIERRMDKQVRRIIKMIKRILKSGEIGDLDPTLFGELVRPLKRLELSIGRQKDYLSDLEEYSAPRKIDKIKKLKRAVDNEGRLLEILAPKSLEVREEERKRTKQLEKAELEKVPETDEIGKVMNDLLDSVKFAPEVKQAALKILIDQMYAIAEQMREVREAKHFHKLQVMMVQHWIELKKLCKDDPELLGKIQTWKSSFIKNKKLMMEMIAGLKEQITDQTQAVRVNWNNCQTLMGHIQNQVRTFIENKYKDDPAYIRRQAKWMPWYDMSDFIEEAVGVQVDESAEYLIDKWCSGINDLNQGHGILTNKLPELQIGGFISYVAKGIRKAARNGAKQKDTEKLQNHLNAISYEAKEVNDILGQIKIIRETHMLSSY